MAGMNGTFSRPTGYICNGELIKTNLIKGANNSHNGTMQQTAEHILEKDAHIVATHHSPRLNTLNDTRDTLSSHI
jgi:hypothetical protein